MSFETVFLILLVAQGLMGGFDTVVNHELMHHLPRHSSSRTEVGLHALRELVYVLLFAGSGWFVWHGWLATLPIGLLIAEFLVSTMDEFIENQTRVLPQNERVLHAFLTLNIGLLLAVSVFICADWISYPADLIVRDPDFFAWGLSFLAVTSLIWAIRDFAAWLRLPRQHGTGKTP